MEQITVTKKQLTDAYEAYVGKKQEEAITKLIYLINSWLKDCFFKAKCGGYYDGYYKIHTFNVPEAFGTYDELPAEFLEMLKAAGFDTEVSGDRKSFMLK